MRDRSLQLKHRHVARRGNREESCIEEAAAVPQSLTQREVAWGARTKFTSNSTVLVRLLEITGENMAIRDGHLHLGRNAPGDVRNEGYRPGPESFDAVCCGEHVVRRDQRARTAAFIERDDLRVEVGSARVVAVGVDDRGDLRADVLRRASGE